MTPTDLRRRGDRFKQNAAVLRRRVAALEKELRAVRSASFSAGSAVAFQDCYRAVGCDLSGMLSDARGRKSVLDPIIDEMILTATNELLARVGLRRIK
jgi:hypothetical protein